MTTPRPADFFLAPMPGYGGTAIRIGEFLNGEGFRKYQHAGILLEGGMTMEAMPSGAKKLHISRFDPDSLRWSTDLVDMTEGQRALIIQYAHLAEGTPYSFLDYGAIALHRFHIPWPGLKNYIADSGHMICSQLVDHVYNRAEVNLFRDKRWEGYVTPASLDMLLDSIELLKTARGI